MVLIRMCRGEVSLEDVAVRARDAAGSEEVRGYVLSATRAYWIVVGQDGAIPLSDRTVFEARLFDGQREWRWLRGEGSGRAAFVGEDVEPIEGWQLVEDGRDPLTHRDHHYLLWGTAVEARVEPGWSMLATPRIGPMEVPVEVDAMQQVVLVAREYLAVLDDHGNVGPWEERWIRLEQAGKRRWDT